MNDYRNYQRHRRNKHFSKCKRLGRKNIPKKCKFITKTQFVTQKSGQHDGELERFNLEQEFWESIAVIDELENICDYNIDDPAFIKATVIDKINKYSTFEFLQKLDLDIWRYIIIQNFLYPHELYGTLLLINNYFNQLFDKSWLLNTLSSRKSLVSYYQGLINIDDIWFYRSMIEMICKLDKIKDDLECVDSLCNCVNSSDWKHMHHDCDNQLCNSKMEKIHSKNCHFAGTAIEISDDDVELKFLECVCSHNEIDVRNDIDQDRLRFGSYYSGTSSHSFRFKRPFPFLSAYMRYIKDCICDKLSCDITDSLLKIYLARRRNYSSYDNTRFENYYKRINDTLFLLTLLHYSPIKDNLLLIKKYNGTQFNSRIFSKNMEKKWNDCVGKLFPSNICICSWNFANSLFFLKSIRSAQNGIFKLDETKMEKSVNDLIYANTGDDHTTNSDNCQLILVPCDNFGQVQDTTN